MLPTDRLHLFNRYLGEWYAEKEISLVQHNESKDMLKKLLDAGLMPNKCELMSFCIVGFEIHLELLGMLLFCTVTDSGEVWTGADSDVGFETVGGADGFTIKLKEGAE